MEPADPEKTRVGVRARLMDVGISCVVIDIPQGKSSSPYDVNMFFERVGLALYTWMAMEISDKMILRNDVAEVANRAMPERRRDRDGKMLWDLATDLLEARAYCAEGNMRQIKVDNQPPVESEIMILKERP